MGRARNGARRGRDTSHLDGCRRHPGGLRPGADRRRIRRRAHSGHRLGRRRPAKPPTRRPRRRARGRCPVGLPAPLRDFYRVPGETVPCGPGHPDTARLRYGQTGENTRRVLMVKYSADGLIPAIVQDARTGEVVMLAYMNEESLQRTLETGQAWFWSRSRRELWHKGATSGNFINVRKVLTDCDSDTILLVADRDGQPAHTAAEVADLLYHTLVLHQATGIEPEAVWEELRKRRG